MAAYLGTSSSPCSPLGTHDLALSFAPLLAVLTPLGTHDLALHRDGRASGRRDALRQDGRLGLEAVGAAEGVEEAC
eukprot:scaffold78990_cov61-Phaeocystis_antarctica.AAC.5